MVGGRLVMPVGPLTPLNTSRSSKKSPLARRQCAPMSGLELLPKAIRPDVPIIMITPMAMLKPSAGRLRAAPTRLRERNPVLSKDKTRIWLARIIKPLADAPYRHRERVFNPDRKESRGRCPARRKPAYLTAGTGAAARPKSCMSRIPDRKNGTGCSRRGR